jgi:ubiquinone/menaquinone biosynthesis C-methylase UbiE
MLNPSFSKKINDIQKGYKLPTFLINKIKEANISFNNGIEMRLQKEYGDEIWKKIYKLELKEKNFNQKNILDICCGTGFLSYHLLKKIKPEELTLIDISSNEISEAQKLLDNNFPLINKNFIVGDATQTKILDNSFDIIIGNSFIHHFYDIPTVLNEIKRLLKNDGFFITLHEPTPAAISYESKSIKQIIAYLILGEKMIDLIRYKGKDISKNSGSDVWIFTKKELIKLAKDSGFKEIKTHSYYIIRPILFAIKKLHLNQNKKKLTKKELFLFKLSVLIDQYLTKILPSKYSGAICIKMKK